MRSQSNLTGHKRRPEIVPNFQQSTDRQNFSSSSQQWPSNNSLGSSSMDPRFVSPGLDERPLPPPSLGSRSGIVNHQGSESQGPRPEFVNDQGSESELF
ncbi:hypothetical protein PanWU01x14_319710, partial [Parasponia andersonii]